jgi:hypothetical protein
MYFSLFLIGKAKHIIDKTILDTIENEELLEDLEKLNISITYSYDDFIGDLRTCKSKLSNSQDNKRIISAIQNHLDVASEKGYIEMINEWFGTNTTYGQKYLKVLSGLFLAMRQILNLRLAYPDSSKSKLIYSLIENKHYGIITRIEQHIRHIYKTMFFLHLVSILSQSLWSMDLDCDIQNNEKAVELTRFLSKYLNINRVFDLTFLQINQIIYVSSINSKKNKLEDNTEREFALLDSIFRILFGCMHEIHEKIIPKGLEKHNFTFFMFDKNTSFDNFNKILKALLHQLNIIIKITYPEDEIFGLIKSIEKIHKQRMSIGTYMFSDEFFVDFFTCYITYVGLSSLADASHYPEILGIFAFTPSILSSITICKGDCTNTIQSFIFQKLAISFTELITNFNLKKFLTLMKLIMIRRLNDTFFKLFMMHKAYLKIPLEDLYSLFFPLLDNN